MREKIKVFHVITRLDRGGSAQNTILTLLGTDERRYRSVLIKGLSLESDMSREERSRVESDLLALREKGVSIVTYSSLVRRITPLLDLRCLIQLFFFFRKERPFIVHTHTSKAGILGRLAAWLAGVPALVHTPHGHIFRGYYGPLLTEIFVLIERLAARVTDKIVCLTEQEKLDHIKLRVSGPGKFVTIHSGVDLSMFEQPGAFKGRVREELGIPEGDPVIGTVGRLVPVKGHEYMIRAFALLMKRYESLWLILIGDGSMRDYLEDLCKDLKIRDRVIFTGWRSDVPGFLSLFDIFVLPSLNEGMGRVLVEAMVAGRPIVASNVGGIPDLVKDGQNGLLVPAADVKALTNGMDFLLANPEKRTEMGGTGKKMAKQYGSDSMVQKIEKLYQGLLKAKMNIL